MKNLNKIISRRIKDMDSDAFDYMCAKLLWYGFALDFVIDLAKTKYNLEGKSD